MSAGCGHAHVHGLGEDGLGVDDHHVDNAVLGRVDEGARKVLLEVVDWADRRQP